MKLANIIGLLGLLSIIVLIIIYIIKPNFQQKFVSSTYVWKLSLKYRKRRINTNKLMNLLLILCQVLILTACAFILARPIVEAADNRVANEKIIVIDASAGMRAEFDKETRFERAITAVKAMLEETFDKEDGRVTIIIAGETAKYLSYTVEVRDENNDMIEQTIEVRRLSSTLLDQVNRSLDSILTSIKSGKLDEYCTYGSGDLDGAISLAETVLMENSECRVDLFTGTQYVTDVDSRVDVHYEEVRASGERNVAILDGSATRNAHYSYNFAVDVAVYGQNAQVEVLFKIVKPNISSANPEGGKDFSERIQATLENGVPKTVVLDTWSYYNDGNDDNSYDAEHTVFSFESVQVTVRVVGDAQFSDALAIDNDYFFYDGKKPTIKVQYFSSLPNPFINTILTAWRTTLANKWEVDTREVAIGDQYETTGFDIYIFEHKMPTTLPDDGVVILLDPSENDPPAETGLFLRETLVANGADGEDVWETQSVSLSSVPNVSHPILKHLVAEDIRVTKKAILGTRTDNKYNYQELMMVPGGDSGGMYPALYLLNEPATKRMIFCVDVNYSNLSQLPGFPLFMLDTFNYFFPTIISQYIYEVGSSATFNSISTEVYCWYPGESESITCPDPTTTIKLDKVGPYTLMQRKINAEEIYTYFFVKAPADESNILRVDYSLGNPYVENKNEANDLDLLIYFAAALVALLFAEWWLQSRNQF